MKRKPRKPEIVWGIRLRGALIIRFTRRYRADAIDALCDELSEQEFAEIVIWPELRALGYRRLFTYTLASESGVSLRAAGWIEDARVRGRSWSCASRPRTDRHPLVEKTRWRAPA